MHSAHKGFVLLTALLLLQVITLMTLYLLNVALLTYQSSQKYWLSYQFFIKSENILQQVVEFEENNNCLLDHNIMKNLKSKSIEWWKNNTCCENDYCYAIELLASNVCMVKQDNYTPVKYLRYTLFSFNPQKHDREWLQSVVIKLDNASQSCVEVYSDISLGQQSWRRL